MEPIQISFFGATNSGKSSLVNAIARQSVSLVSDLPGTTTDPVRKRMELPGIGPCVLVDTAGYGDAGVLGAQRERLTKAVIDSTHIAVLIRSSHPADSEWETMLKSAGVSVISITPDTDRDAVLEQISTSFRKEEEIFLTGNLVKAGDVVVLVMPQDSEAPKGRIILPQVQVLRELLDRACIPVCCTPEQLPKALDNLKEPPALVITDSQAFKQVNDTIPATWPLTSFSILLAAAKGDIRLFSEGAKAIDKLHGGDRVLIAEACTHVPNSEDIGRVKIPALLKKKILGLQVTIASGKDFPENLTDYKLIIHCGACVASARLVKSRINKALQSGVPITNYGIALAYLQGILERISLP
jgi:[FeFe] hydrogenase H-cluster maturation GTPase HydF